MQRVSRLSAATSVAALMAAATVPALADTGEAQHHDTYGIAGFIGGTHAHNGNEFTLGFEAGMNLGPTWSIGVVVERAERERDSTLLLFGVGWHPLGPELRFQAGIGQKDPAGKHENVLRLGVAYELGIGGHWFVKPYLAADFIQDAGNEEVFGLYIGRGF